MFNFLINLLNKMKNKDIKIANLNSFVLVSTFFSLWFAVYFEQQVEELVAYFLILSFGILHGANDIKLIQNSENPDMKTPFYMVLIKYVAIIILSTVVFYFFPLIALVLFVTISAYHFGEQHWLQRLDEKSSGKALFFVVYGLLLLFMLFATNAAEVNLVIKNLTGFLPSDTVYMYLFVFCSAMFLVMGTVLYLKKRIKSNILEEVFYLLVFFVVFKTASLLWAFAIYFILWHSIPSLKDQITVLYGRASARNFIKYLRSSLLYWAISVFGLALFYFLFRDHDKVLMSLLFSFLAAITFPHVWVMRKFNEK